MFLFFNIVFSDDPHCGDVEEPRWELCGVELDQHP
jgi:hypothetical protein